MNVPFKPIVLMLMCLFMILTTGCFDDEDEPGPPPNAVSGDRQNPNENPGDTPDPIVGAGAAAITLNASQVVILTGATTQIAANVTDSSGDPVEAGTAVTFALGSTDYGVLSSSTAATNAQGIASVAFTGGDTEGSVTVTATVGGVSSNSITIDIDRITDPDIASAITISSPSPSVLMIEGTSSVSATVFNSSGEAIGEGVTVTFSADNPTIGNVSPATVTTNAAGVATTTFTATQKIGEVNISASASGVRAEPAIITVIGASPAVLTYHDTTSNVIAVKGSGGIEYSRIRFIVKDDVDRPVPGEPVAMTLINGPGGGEYIDETDDSPETINVSTDEEGYASVFLHSGVVAGPVTIQATIMIDETPMSVNAAVVSIGGGVPSQERFDVAGTILNLPGLYVLGFETNITAYLADRFGNYNILDGTTVSFSPETGLTAYSSSTSQVNAKGLATVTLRTQNEPQDVAPRPWETELINYVNANYMGATITGHPRDGVCSILVHTKGEEKFSDLNGNGYYDQGTDLYFDTYDDPFCDYDDDGEWDDGTDNPAELYIDVNNEGASRGICDGYNYSWDADKSIFKNFKVLITGEPIILFNREFDIPNGGSDEIRVIICDQNLNRLSVGTKLSVDIATPLPDCEITGGTTSYEYPNLFRVGNDMDSHLSYIEYSIVVSDKESSVDNTDAPQINSLEVTVLWEGLEYTKKLSGLVR